MTKVTIIGSGAMASLFSARLANICEVYMLGSWASQIQTLQQKPLQLIDGATTSEHSIHATNNIADIPEVQWIILLVKSFQTARAAQQAKQLWSNETKGVITLQNGLGNWEKLRGYFEKEQCVVGVTTQGAKIISPGVVEDTGRGNITLAKTSVTSNLANLLRKCSWEVEVTDNIDALLWKKLAINAGINPLTAILQQKNGYLIENPIAQKIMNTLAKEAVSVAKAQGIDVHFIGGIEKCMYDVAKQTAKNHSSMLCDRLRNSPTEIDAICGEVIRRGKKYNVATPANQLVYDMIDDIHRYDQLPDVLRYIRDKIG
ncbi:2-dehydropantoate 2-reductase [Candidatus Uabimicrobium amorphum]|uniref:2-dehydropantoate 2-reductase n=2 Tax=Uabimicrobium amorphum TaxID=2596890 RepID=A0A5S9IMH0_UABAM|nr:2-dehydropantoate 2-reductase [Candidatus Uabimicrobium amorphum]